MNLFYDRKENKESIYQMYQQIFEDPEAFAQYYFREIYPHNQVLLAAEDDEIKGMIHLNPYNIKIGIEEQKLNCCSCCQRRISKTGNHGKNA